MIGSGLGLGLELGNRANRVDVWAGESLIVGPFRQPRIVVHTVAPARVTRMYTYASECVHACMRACVLCTRACVLPLRPQFGVCECQRAAGLLFGPGFANSGGKQWIQTVHSTSCVYSDECSRFRSSRNVTWLEVWAIV